jgi:hypothetical protein
VATTPIVYNAEAGDTERDGPTLRGSELDPIRQHRFDVVLRGNQGLGAHNNLIVAYDREPGNRQRYLLATIERLLF